MIFWNSKLDLWMISLQYLDSLCMYVYIYIINIYVSLYIPNLPRLGHVSTPSVPASASCRVFPISCNASARAAAASAARSAAWSGWKVFLGQWGNRGNMYMITVYGYIYIYIIYNDIYIYYIYIYPYTISIYGLDILRLNRMLIRIDNMMGVSEIGVYSLWPVEYAKQW